MELLGSGRLPLPDVRAVVSQLRPARWARNRMPSRVLQAPVRAVQAQLSSDELRACIRAGDRVALAIGSRGISHLQQVVATVVGWLRVQGGRRYLVLATEVTGRRQPARRNYSPPLGWTRPALRRPSAPWRTRTVAIAASLGEPAEIRLEWIKNTLELGEIVVTKPFGRSLTDRTG